MEHQESHRSQHQPSTASVHVLCHQDEGDDLTDAFCSCLETAERAVRSMNAEDDDETYCVRTKQVHTSTAHDDPRKAAGLWMVSHPWKDSADLHLDENDAQAQAAAIDDQLRESGEHDLDPCRPHWRPMHHGAHFTPPNRPASAQEAPASP